MSDHIVSGLEVAGLVDDNFCELPETCTQKHMPVHRGNIPRERDLHGWAHLKSVHLPEIDAEIEHKLRDKCF